KDEAENLEAKNRALSRLKIQLENNLSGQLRKNKINEEKLLNYKRVEQDLRSEMKKLNETIKELSANHQQAEEKKSEIKANEKEEMRKMQQLNIVLTAKNRELEERLKDMVTKNSGDQNALNSGQQNVSSKEKRLEAQTKKLNSELSKAKVMIADEK